MKLQQIMGDTIAGIVVRKNSVLILRSRSAMDAEKHAKYGAQITKWGASVGVRATLVPHDFDVLVVDDEDGATLLQNAQADVLRGEIAMLRVRLDGIRAELKAEIRAMMDDGEGPVGDPQTCAELGIKHV